MSGGSDKTEKPTPKRLKEARRKGQTARTPDLGAWVGILAAVVVLPMVLRQGSLLTEQLLAEVPKVIADPNPVLAVAALRTGLRGLLTVVGPVAGATVLAGVVSGVAQGGGRPATDKLKPKMDHLNPLKGIKRIFGMQSLWEGSKALLKTVILGAVLWSTAKSLVPVLVGSGTLPLAATIATTRSAVGSMIRVAVLAGLVLAVADYVVARRRVMKQLRMTRKEVTDEHKQSEGDPHVKGQIRSRQMAMSRNRMMSQVATADVVLVNPTHVAVALRYSGEKGAPRVVARGAGAVAAKIRERATEHRVPMVADVPLARAVYAACDLGREIPPELFMAVARVLAFVMSLRSRGSAAGVHRLPMARAS